MPKAQLPRKLESGIVGAVGDRSRAHGSGSVVARAQDREVLGFELNSLNDSFSDRTLEGLTFGALLGQGGMSRVHEAATADGRRVAVKLPRADSAAAGRALIRREFEFLNAISHPNVVAVSGLSPRAASLVPAAGLDRGIVMEYLGGGDLVSLAGSSPRCWVPLAVQVARAVDDLHGAGIVHRDLKPRNVLLGSGDVPRLIDFALAARIGGVAPRGGGTAAYRRSGRFEGADAADDVYALAVLVYELWFGALPFGRHPTPQARNNWRGVPEPGPTPGIRGLRRLAGILADVLAQHPAALSAGIRPVRHALESVVSNH